jgi:hypothetical protein
VRPDIDRIHPDHRVQGFILRLLQVPIGPKRNQLRDAFPMAPPIIRLFRLWPALPRSGRNPAISANSGDIFYTVPETIKNYTRRQGAAGKQIELVENLQVTPDIKLRPFRGVGGNAGILIPENLADIASQRQRQVWHLSDNLYDLANFGIASFRWVPAKCTNDT